MALNYTTSKRNLDYIAARVVTADDYLKQARDLIAKAETEMTNLQTTYGGFVTELDSVATSNPSDPAWQAAKAEKDLMVSDFNALKARAISLKNAFDAV